jgi:hypothetical protein
MINNKKLGGDEELINKNEIYEFILIRHKKK